MTNMTKLKQNRKKLIIAIAALLVLAIASGLTYAWFTASATGQSQYNMGNMGLVVTPLTETYVYEPGIATTGKSTLKNNGSLPLVVALDSSATTANSDLLYSLDNDGNMVSDPHTVANDPNVTVAMASEEDFMTAPVLDNDGNLVSCWLRYGSTPATYRYLLMLAPGAEASVEFDVAFSSKMGNDYMDAKIKVTEKWQATQFLDGAIKDVFGLDASDFDDIVAGMGGRSGRSAVGGGDIEKARAYVLEQLNR